MSLGELAAWGPWAGVRLSSGRPPSAISGCATDVAGGSGRGGVGRGGGGSAADGGGGGGGVAGLGL